MRRNNQGIINRVLLEAINTGKTLSIAQRYLAVKHKIIVTVSVLRSRLRNLKSYEQGE